MKMINGKDILDVKATSTDSAGNGYYRASDGNYYYGNAQNGYLVETEETKRLKAEKARMSMPHNQSNRNYSSQNAGLGNSLADWIAVSIGTKVGEMLGKILFIVGPFLVKVLCVFGMLPAIVSDYIQEFIFHNMHVGYMLLSALGLVLIFALIGYGIYRSIKGQKSLSKPIFIAEILALTGIYYLNMKNEELALLASVFMALFFAYSVKVLSNWLDKIVYNIWKKVHANK